MHVDQREERNNHMDPVSTAIVAALTVGISGGMTEMGKKAITDAYEALKVLLKKKFGNQSEVVKSVEHLEAKPDSPARKDLLQEEVTVVQADRDQEICQAAQALLDQISLQPGGKQHIQNAIGSYIAQADRGSAAQANINHPKDYLCLSRNPSIQPL